MIHRHGLLAAAVVGSAIACGADRTLSPITAAQLCAQQDALVAAAGPSPNLDDDFDILAHLLPGGFGGLTVNYWYLKQPALADTARATARALSACPGEPFVNLWAVVQLAPVRAGTYDWLQLRQWYQQLLRAGGAAGLATSDIDESTNRLAFTFTTQAALDTFRTRADALGIPPGALTLTLSPAAVAVEIVVQPLNER